MIVKQGPALMAPVGLSKAREPIVPFSHWLRLVSVPGTQNIAAAGGS